MVLARQVERIVLLKNYFRMKFTIRAPQLQDAQNPYELPYRIRRLSLKTPTPGHTQRQR